MGKATATALLRVNKNVSMDTIAASVALTVTLTSALMFSQYLISKDTSESYSEHIALKKEMMQSRRDNFFMKPSLAKQSLPKTERAKKFDSQSKSEKYWKDLYASLSESKKRQAPKKKTGKPPVVIGSKD